MTDTPAVQMTNLEAILRLSVDTADGQALGSLRHNNAVFIRATLTRYFGSGPLANQAERVLMLRMADRARSYDQQENADRWFARYATVECDRLRNEAIHDRANSD